VRRLLLVAIVAAALVGWWAWASLRVGVVVQPLSLMRRHFTRPYGMTPVAFKALIQACNAAQVAPRRIGQTLGNHPLSKGYHLKDGVLHGEPYCAAVDLGASDLTPHKRAELLEALARCGFAAWYRSGPKWAGDEHVHAIYAGLSMKAQLKEQVRLWNRERRKSGRKIFKWQKRWRRYWR